MVGKPCAGRGDVFEVWEGRAPNIRTELGSVLKEMASSADLLTAKWVAQPSARSFCRTDSLWKFRLQLCCGLAHNALGGLPIDALIGDGLAVGELVEGLGELLIPGDEVAFEHGSND